MKVPKTNGKKADAKSEPKNQKTIVDFFKRQSAAPSPIVKISCPACQQEVPQSKLNWHLDQDCKSRSKLKKKRDGNLTKRKKILKSVKDEIRNKTKKKVMLSDDESDDTLDSDDDILVLDTQDSSEGDCPYIPSSMVETRIFELDDVPGGSQYESSCSSSATNGNSCVSPSQEMIFEHQDLNSAERRIAGLKSDWVSPYLPSPVKTKSNIKTEPQEEVSNINVEASEGTSFAQVITAGKNVQKMLQSDWNDNSPMSSPKSPINRARSADREMEDFEANPVRYATPQKFSKQSPKSMYNTKQASTDVNKNIFDKQKNFTVISSPNISQSKKSSNLMNCKKSDEDSGDDFEEPIQYRTPDKLCRKTLKNGKGSGKKTKSDSDDTSRTTNTLPSPAAVNSESDGESSTPLRSPRIVSPTRSPIPVSDSANLISNDLVKTTECVKKQLFTLSGTSSKSNQRDALEPTPSTSNASSAVLQKEESCTKMSQDFEDEDPFDALLVSASQKAEESESRSLSQSSSVSPSPVKGSERMGRIRIRTPRKINQSIKSTGLLQSSPQNVSRNFFPKKRHSSVSPEKVGSSQDSLPNSQSSQNSPNKKYDKAMFRGHKGYYLENFLLILECVFSEPTNLQLFNDEDRSLVESFHQLSLQAQKLYVRLFQRKVKWNKVSKIEYRDICDQEDTELYVRELSYANYLSVESHLNELDEVLQLLSADDLKTLCKIMKVSAAGKKENMVKALQNISKQQRSVMNVFMKGPSKSCAVLKQAKELLGQCCIINKEVRRVFMRMIMLYGLPKYDDDEDTNNHTQLTALLMVNLGKMQFPKYEIVKHHAIFRSRDDLIRFETCSQMLTDVSECLENQKWEEALTYCKLAKTTYEELISNKELMDHDLSLPRFLRHYSPISILIHILSCSVECYQRLKNYRKAVEQLRFLLNQTTHLQDYRGRWCDRLALNLEAHLKLPAEAVDVIKSALNDPEVREGHRLSVSMRAERMASSPRYKSLAPAILELPLMKPRESPRVIIEGRCLPGDAGYKRVFISQDSDRHAGEGEVTVCSVEELVLSYYKKEGYGEGLHREGTTMNSLFGLFFWDIIYSPIPDVFQSHHQAAPLDLDDPHFYTARKDVIEERLRQLQTFTEEDAAKEIDRIWEENFGKTAMVAWDIFRSPDYAKGLVSSLTLPVLASICRRLAKDHRFTRSGFPDLVVWNPVEKKCRIVEVKGPNDRLSTKQILWLDYLLENGANAEVCHVEAIGAKKMKLASPRRISPKKRSPVKKPKKQADDESDVWEPENKAKGKRVTRKRPKEEAEDDEEEGGRPTKIRKQNQKDVKQTNNRKKKEEEEVEIKTTNAKEESKEEVKPVRGNKKNQEEVKAAKGKRKNQEDLIEPVKRSNQGKSANQNEKIRVVEPVKVNQKESSESKRPKRSSRRGNKKDEEAFNSGDSIKESKESSNAKDCVENIPSRTTKKKR